MRAQVMVGTSSLTDVFSAPYFDKETNLHYNYFRDYDPAIGRYIQSDPIGLRGGINTYLYVLADPLTGTEVARVWWTPSWGTM